MNPSPASKSPNLVERLLENILWGSRLVVLVAVLGSLAVGFAMFFVATIDAVHLMGGVAEYATSPPTAHDMQHAETVAHIVEVIDGYLLATMLIFAFGLYELFISRIDVPLLHRELASRVLLIKSLDDLKDRLAKVVLLILVVKFFEHALAMPYQKPLDLVMLGLGIALIAAAIYLSHKSGHSATRH